MTGPSPHPTPQQWGTSVANKISQVILFVCCDSNIGNIFFFSCEDPLKFFFYYKEFFSYWGLLDIVKAPITYHWWVLINTSSVIHTLITIHNVSLAYKVFSGHFPVSPPPPPTPELTAVLPSSWLILQILEFHMNGAIWRVLFYIKLISLSMLFFRLIHAVLYFASSFLSVVERKSIVWICHILFSHILTMDTCCFGIFWIKLLWTFLYNLF